MACAGARCVEQPPGYPDLGACIPWHLVLSFAVRLSADCIQVMRADRAFCQQNAFNYTHARRSHVRVYHHAAAAVTLRRPDARM